MPFLALSLAHARERAVTALGAARFEAELETGRHLGRDSALALALGQPAHADVPAAASADLGLLGKRQADVARLIADGLTNRQIGARLFISERTVDSHVRSILSKLGVSSRAQIAAWMASSPM
jgi:DNA-binding NarL/FixJ family response regulator